MQHPTFADPKTDFVFRRIFGSEQRKDVLFAFLNDMLDLEGPRRIVGVELLAREQRPPVAELELSILDVTCTDARGVTYIVEIQTLQVEGFERRVVDNVAKAYVNQIARGDGPASTTSSASRSATSWCGPTPRRASSRC
jgi:predicted transposase/invertase (TIGR01784 family)